MSQVTLSPSPQSTLLPGRATADGTHRRLLEEALLRFGERGFHGVSVREITKAACVRASSLYAHIDSKEQLLFQLMLIGHEEHHDQLRDALLEASPDPVDQITRLVQAHVVVHATYPLLCRLSNRELAALTPTSQERIVAVRHESEQMFHEVIAAGTARGVFSPVDPWLAVAAIGAMGIRVAEWWPTKAYQPETVARSYAAFAVRLLIAS